LAIMAEHETNQAVWQEPGTFETAHQPEESPLPTQPVELGPDYMRNLQASLYEATLDPGAYEGYQELGVVYDAARAILLASRAGRPVTPPIPRFVPEMAPLVNQLFLSRRSGSGYVSLPVRFDPAEGQERPEVRNVMMSSCFLDEFSLVSRTNESGQRQFYYSTFPWDKK
jgi:hypothetical protein